MREKAIERRLQQIITEMLIVHESIAQEEGISDRVAVAKL